MSRYSDGLTDKLSVGDLLGDLLKADGLTITSEAPLKISDQAGNEHTIAVHRALGLQEVHGLAGYVRGLFKTPAA